MGQGDTRTTAQKRKNQPVFSGVLKYFPDALLAVAECSLAGNEQHNPGSPLHWDRFKSADELDALTRHLVDHASGTDVDSDGILHMTKVAWRSLAYLQKHLEGGKKNDQKETLGNTDNKTQEGKHEAS